MKLYLKYIILGWWNWLLDKISDLKYKKQFDERLEICKACEKYSCGFCKICGCVVTAKTKCEESKCPINKWDAIKNTIK